MNDTTLVRAVFLGRPLHGPPRHIRFERTLSAALVPRQGDVYVTDDAHGQPRFLRVDLVTWNDRDRATRIGHDVEIHVTQITEHDFDQTAYAT